MVWCPKIIARQFAHSPISFCFLHFSRPFVMCVCKYVFIPRPTFRISTTAPHLWFLCGIIGGKCSYLSTSRIFTHSPTSPAPPPPPDHEPSHRPRHIVVVVVGRLTDVQGRSSQSKTDQRSNSCKKYNNNSLAGERRNEARRHSLHTAVHWNECKEQFFTQEGRGRRRERPN